MIVLGRAAFANLASDQWMAGKDRYQYVGSMAGAVALGVVAGALVRGWRIPERLKTGLVCAWAVAALGVTMTMAPPIDHHASGRLETADALRVIDAVVAAKPPGRDVFIANRPFNSLVYPVPMETFPGWAAIFAIFHRDDVVDGRRVCFVISDARTLAAARHGRRAPGLLCGLARPAPP
jgi:hypothetical protein